MFTFYINNGWINRGKFGPKLLFFKLESHLPLYFVKKLFNRALTWYSVTLKFNCVISVWTTNHFAEPFNNALVAWKMNWLQPLWHSDVYLDQIWIEFCIDVMMLIGVVECRIYGGIFKCWRDRRGAGCLSSCKMQKEKLYEKSFWLYQMNGIVALTNLTPFRFHHALTQPYSCWDASGVP